MIEDLEKILPHNYAEAILSIGKIRDLAVGEYFIRAGEIPKKMGFVKTGIFRYVYINQEGIEYTKGIIQEGSFISSYSSMIAESPSHFYVESLERAEILEIPYQKWQTLLTEDNFWDKFLIRILQKAFAKKEKRERDFLLLDAPARYTNFLKEYPNLQDRIKLNIIASYLGIHPESLSRIRKKIKN